MKNLLLLIHTIPKYYLLICYLWQQVICLFVQTRRCVQNTGIFIFWYIGERKKQTNKSRELQRNSRLSAKLGQIKYYTLVSKVCFDGIWIRCKLPLLSPTTRNCLSWHMPTTSTLVSEKDIKMSAYKIFISKHSWIKQEVDNTVFQISSKLLL